MQGSQAKGRALLEESQALCREMGHKEGMVRTLGLLGQVSLFQGDAVKARSLLEEAPALSREIGHLSIADLLIVLGRMAKCLGDEVKARDLYEESQAFAREVGPSNLLPPYLEGWADMVATQGDPASA